MKSLALNKEELHSELIGIGIFMSGKRPNFKKRPLTPEKVLLEASKAAISNRLILNLIYTWVHTNSEILYADAFRAAFKEEENHLAKIFVSAILASLNDDRFDKLISHVEVAKDNEKSLLGKDLFFAAEIGQTEFDKYFLNYGLKISQLKKESEKKFLPLEHVINDNPFIRCRLLFGTGVRADVAALLMLGLKNPSEIRDVLNCSYESAHRNVNSLKKANWPMMAEL